MEDGNEQRSRWHAGAPINDVSQVVVQPQECIIAIQRALRDDGGTDADSDR